jgi:hypothetical protein
MLLVSQRVDISFTLEEPTRWCKVAVDRAYVQELAYVGPIYQGRIQGGRTRRAPSPKIGKNMIFWLKIVIFHTKYPKTFRASLRSAQFF